MSDSQENKAVGQKSDEASRSEDRPLDAAIDPARPKQQADQQIEQDPEQAALEVLEKALQENDPNFNEALKVIGPDLLPEHIDGFGLDSEVQELSEKTVLRFLAKLKKFIRTKSLILKTHLLLFFKQTVPDLVRSLFDSFAAMLVALKIFFGKFRKLNSKQKLGLIMSLLIASLAVFLVYRVITRGLVPEKVTLFTSQLDELAAEEFTVSEEDVYSNFYDSPRVSQNVMVLKRMFTNVKVSALSGPRPMVAVEFFIEGYAPEVIIEVKDREAEIQHLFQRVIEGFTYDDLDSLEGKKRLQERLRTVGNRVLTQGNIKRVFFKNFILKP